MAVGVAAKVLIVVAVVLQGVYSRKIRKCFLQPHIIVVAVLLVLQARHVCPPVNMHGLQNRTGERFVTTFCPL
jgi:hypothetical protein